MSNWQYRKYMTDNATLLMKKNMFEVCKEQMAYPPVFDYRIGSPFLYQQPSERTTPIGYEHSDLKLVYLDKKR